MQKKNKKYNIGIVLGGGGARGFAHIGVLKALNESGIYPEIISGVSAGAIIGSLYADGYSPDEILALFKQNKLFNYLKLINPKQGLFKMTGLAKVISKNLKAKTFEELKLPLIINATDLNNGKCEYFSSGELFKHILASSTIPGLFPFIFSKYSFGFHISKIINIRYLRYIMDFEFSYSIRFNKQITLFLFICYFMSYS